MQEAVQQEPEQGPVVAPDPGQGEPPRLEHNMHYAKLPLGRFGGHGATTGPC